MSFWGYRDYVSVAERRAKAIRELEKLRKTGVAASPVAIEGRKIAKQFWGKAWCDNLERYSDYANRLPRGRSYVTNGLVIDLQVARGKVEALVSGSETYKVKIDIAVAAPARWKAICGDCAGSVGSIVELLQGKLTGHVMERVCRPADGLFPAPGEIKMACSCPDWAGLCKHVAATLYGVGARLDRDPDLLFTLRGVERAELVSTGADVSITQVAAGGERVLADDDLSALFGLEIDAPAPVVAPPAKPAKPKPAAVKPLARAVAAPAPAAKNRTAAIKPVAAKIAIAKPKANASLAEVQKFVDAARSRDAERAALVAAPRRTKPAVRAAPAKSSTGLARVTAAKPGRSAKPPAKPARRSKPS
jgi:uncharacterized Zn finger protein